MNKKLIELLRIRFKESLQSKTSWGRNDLMLVFESVLADVVVELLDETEKPSS